MCGELDDNLQINKDILDRFRVMSRMLGVQPGTATRQAGSLETPEGRADYMDRIFNGTLATTLAEIEQADDEETVDAIASHAIALARLAGFLAGQLPPDADLFRPVIEAVSAGHAETAQLAARHRQAQDHHHHHDHHTDAPDHHHEH